MRFEWINKCFKYHFKKKATELKLLNAREFLRDYVTDRRQHSGRNRLHNHNPQIKEKKCPEIIKEKKKKTVDEKTLVRRGCWRSCNKYCCSPFFATEEDPIPIFLSFLSEFPLTTTIINNPLLSLGLFVRNDCGGSTWSFPRSLEGFLPCYLFIFIFCYLLFLSNIL